MILDNVNKQINILRVNLISFTDHDNFFSFLKSKENEKDIKIHIANMIFHLNSIQQTIYENNSEFIKENTVSIWIESYYTYLEFYEFLVEEYTTFLLEDIKNKKG